MSLAHTDFPRARNEIILSPSTPAEKLTALEVVARLEAAWFASERNAAWKVGRKGDGVAKIPGLTDTLTALVRRFAACGIVRHSDVPDLHRHKSALCKALKSLAPEVKITTVIGIGYEIVSGADGLYRLLHAGKTPGLRAPGFTVKQTAILQVLAQRGSVHVDQIACLQRHMSNIRAKLPKHIIITTHPGEGLYTVDDKSREALQALIAGEVALPQPARRVALQLVAA